MDFQEFIDEFTPFLVSEAHFTETQNDSPEFLDYIADIETLCSRMLAGEHPFTESD